ncbi:MAG: FKBP-type peptidyl-prolyl cis-trans isomerase [Acidobacteriota bacterium]
MKLIQLIILAIVLTMTVPVPIAHGQTNNAKARNTRARRRTPTKPPSRGADAATSIANTTPSGLTYIITHHTKGRLAVAGDTVMVHYTGLLTNGVKFDSSHDRGEPYSFVLGRGRVIGGWDEGIAKLRIGEQGTLIIPPQLGYGAEGSAPVIPPNATLVFVVELVSIK